MPAGSAAFCTYANDKKRMYANAYGGLILMPLKNPVASVVSLDPLDVAFAISNLSRVKELSYDDDDDEVKVGGWISLLPVWPN